MQSSQPCCKATVTTTLVLLPGLDGTEVFFRPLIAALPAWIRPLVVTYPASGPNGYADLLAIVQRAIADTQDFYVLGWSFSGPLALMLATAEPRRARGVILAASFVRSPLPVLPWFRFATVPPVVGLIRMIRRMPAWFWTDEFRRDKAATWARVSARVLAVRARAILAVDAREHLRACPRPVLYLAGSRDTVVPTPNAHEIVSVLPSARVVTIDGPHFALYMNPEAAAQVIVQFMEDGESG